MMFDGMNGQEDQNGVALLDAPSSENPWWAQPTVVGYDDDLDEDESYFLEADDDEDDDYDDDVDEEFEEEYEEELDGGDDSDDDDDL